MVISLVVQPDATRVLFHAETEHDKAVLAILARLESAKRQQPLRQWFEEDVFEQDLALTFEPVPIPLRRM